MNGNVFFGAGIAAAGGIGFLAAQQGFGSVHPIVSVVAIILISLPSFHGLIRAVGWNRGLAILSGLGVFALLVEALGVWSGFPYGAFQYIGTCALDGPFCLDSTFAWSGYFGGSPF
jgi:uncharacterized membrane protein